MQCLLDQMDDTLWTSRKPNYSKWQMYLQLAIHISISHIHITPFDYHLYSLLPVWVFPTIFSLCFLVADNCKKCNRCISHRQKHFQFEVEWEKNTDKPCTPTIKVCSVIVVIANHACNKYLIYYKMGFGNVA